MTIITNPAEIEAKSFEIISKEMAGRELDHFDPINANIIKRVIHTTADFDYADTLCFSHGAVGVGIDGLRPLQPRNKG